MSDKFLKDTYDLKSAQETQEHYQRWAASYDTEVGSHTYVTPDRVAAALRPYVPDADTPILDYGCGTGLSGLALHKAGFRAIDGMDPTPEMLEGARIKGVYRTLIPFDIADPAPVEAGKYPVIAAIGVVGAGAAPPETFDLLMNALPRGGYLAFSFNDHTLADHAYTSRLNDWLDMGHARLLFREYGPHLVGMDMKSDVYVVDKL
ncbi:methyltransferase type 11 [Rhodobacteraceae bacterium KLH11]|nr:methyltransferase type 11 [Rhodobacteraceae bacterium KLH11]